MPRRSRLLVLAWLGLCLALNQPLAAGSLTIQVSDANHEPLPDAVVYLLADRELPATKTDSRYEVEQKDKTFQPFVTVIPVGATVMFPNRDGIGHHVYSFSPPRKFELPLSEHESTDTITFDQPGLVTVGCNIHDWMAAYIYVVATPYHAKSDANGQAVIEDLPAGVYDLHVTHPGIKGAADLTRRFDAATENRLEFTLEVKPEYLWRPESHAEEEPY